MRAFTALWLSVEAAGHVSAALRRLPEDRLAEATRNLRGFRLMPSRQWHLTLCFHGDGIDPEQTAARLDHRVAEHALVAPRLRLAGGGTFRGVLWLGLEFAADADADAFTTLVRAAGGDPDTHSAHLTVARWNEGKPNREALSRLLVRYEGPWWSPGGIVLVRSDQTADGPVYSTVHRVPLQLPPLGDEGTREQP